MKVTIEDHQGIIHNRDAVNYRPVHDNEMGMYRLDTLPPVGTGGKLSSCALSRGTLWIDELEAGQ